MTAVSFRALLVALGACLSVACTAYDRSQYAQLVDGGGDGDAPTDANRVDVADARDGAATCAPPLTECGSRCVDLTSSPTDCGACGAACPGTTCSNSRCTNDCLFARLDCDSNAANGCEVDAVTDSAHCGSCAHACPAGVSCVQGACATSGTTTVGSPCVAATDCAAGFICLTDAMGFPGGYCTKICPDGCPEGSTCSSYGFCAPLCTDASMCRSGYFCAGSGTQRGCLPQCTSIATSGANLCGAARCDSATNMCIGNCNSPDQCSAGSTCDFGVCRCTAATACGTGRTCQDGNCVCASDAACPAGYRCVTGNCTP